MKNEVVEKLATLITAAFGLVAALAWNDTIKLIFKQLFSENSNISAMLIYALSVTILAVVITIILGKFSEKAKKPLKIRKRVKNKLKNRKKSKKR